MKDFEVDCRCLTQDFITRLQDYVLNQLFFHVVLFSRKTKDQMNANFTAKSFK